ncbi:AI-2E family transporter [Lacibacterium aquatile]|uniref:AI-2E family transporter n=1 Tax=Lacibacterium aquatile TaxID=1168082 RepID=A0ABW5DYV8_9PROT
MANLSVSDAVPPEVADSQPLPSDMPLPTDPRVVFQGGLFLLALLAACYVASDIVLPIVLAFIFKLLLHPAIRLLERVRVPRVLAAILVILAVFGAIVGFGAALSGPASNWAANLPEGVPRLQERLSFLSAPVETLRHFMHQAEGFTQVGAGTAAAPAVKGPSLWESLFVGTQHFASGLFTMLLILFFLLMSGDTFLRRLVEILPRFKDKRQIVDISQQIESDISAYLSTITLMNLGVGIATGLMTWVFGLEDPVLWGSVAFLLNYIPIIGPIFAAGILLLAGLLSLDPLWRALLPAGCYFAIHIIEGQGITPLLLARRFTLNPVVVILALVFWFWMWGVPGAIISVPMLAIAKIICNRIRGLAAFGHFLSG